MKKALFAVAVLAAIPTLVQAQETTRRPHNTENGANVAEMKRRLFSEEAFKTPTGKPIVFKGRRPDDSGCKIQLTATQFGLTIQIDGKRDGSEGGFYRVSTAATYSVDFEVSYRNAAISSSQVMTETGGERPDTTKATLSLVYGRPVQGIAQLKSVVITNTSSSGIDVDGKSTFDDAHVRVANCSIR